MYIHSVVGPASWTSQPELPSVPTYDTPFSAFRLALVTMKFIKSGASYFQYILQMKLPLHNA
jgi:hypothetical protein